METELPPDLLKAVEDRKCVLFIGSGVSAAVGIPSVSHLAETLLADIAKYDSFGPYVDAVRQSGARLSDVATLYKRAFPNDNAHARVADLIEEATATAKHDLHDQLRLLPTVQHIFTTNWDALIERSFPAADRRVIRRAGELGDIDHRKTNIYKIHGDVFDPSSMVLDTPDYDDVDVSSNEFIDHLRALARSHVVLFLGYGLSDDYVRRALKDIPRTLYYVTLEDKPLAEVSWKPARLVRIPGDATGVLGAIVAEFETRAYRDSPVGPTHARPPDSTQSANPFEIYETEFMADRQPDAFVDLFVEPVKFDRILAPANTVIEGHRGSGKSMILRYVSILHEAERHAPLPFWGFYVKLEGGFFEGVSRRRMKDDEWQRYFQHYFNLLLITGISDNVSHALSRHVLGDHNAQALRDAVLWTSQRLLRLDSQCATLGELCEAVYYEMDTLRNDPAARRYTTPPRAPREFVRRLAGAIPALRNRYACLLLDEWDNMSAEQQRVVVMRLHDRDPHLRYKVGTKTLGFHEQSYQRKVDFIHDYEFTRLDHHLFVGPEKQPYIDFVRAVANKRLAQHATTIEVLLPEVEGEPTSGLRRPEPPEPAYSGFENLCMISSGVVREFLELVKDALYYSQPELTQGIVKIKPIAPKWQHHAARVHGAIHFANVHACRESDHVLRLLTTMGGTFKRIDAVTRRRSGGEHRHPLTIDVTDIYNADTFLKEVLRDAVSNRLLQLPELPLQPRNVWEGPKQKFTLHRLLTPYFRLSPFERFTVPASVETLQLALREPKEAITVLTQAYMPAQSDHNRRKPGDRSRSQTSLSFDSVQDSAPVSDGLGDDGASAGTAGADDVD